MPSYGISVTSRFPHSPLAKVSAGALRLWLLLAAKGDHAPFTRNLGGQRVTVKTGQVLTSVRQMEADGFGAKATLTRHLGTLAHADLITLKAIERFRNANASGIKTETLERTQNVNAGLTVATLVTVNGFRRLRDQSVHISETKRDKGSSDGLTAAERAENRRAIQQLEAEGR